MRNDNDYQSPESFLWSKVTNKKERFNLWENNIMSRDGREKEKLFIFFLCLSIKDSISFVCHQFNEHRQSYFRDQMKGFMNGALTYKITINVLMAMYIIIS